MMLKNAGAKDRLMELFSGQKLAVLSTARKDGHPYASLVAFVAAEDLQSIYFATSRATRKYENLQKDPRVAVLVNNSINISADFYQAISVTGMGNAAELSGDTAGRALLLYVEKHPYLEDFVRSPSCGLFQVTMTTYYLVENFQNVTEVHI